MAKYAQGIFQPTNPQKYVGRGAIHYRSSWEFVFMNFCDKNENIIQWANESIHIPYRNPLTGKNTIYVPDFLVNYMDKDGNQHAEVIEVKPSKETTMEGARSQRDRAMVAINMAKWQAAHHWCKQQGLTFRVITESDIFAQGRKR